MRNIVKKVIPKRPLYLQILFTLFAFFAMVVLSYVFVNRIVLDDLMRNTDSILDYVEAQITADLTEIHTALGSFSQTIRSMIIN